MLIFVFLLVYSNWLIAAIPENLELSEIANGVSPLAFVSAYDGTGKMYIVEQAGIIKEFDQGESIVFLDVSDKVETIHTDQGLLGLVFDPNYSTNGFFYINYTKEGGVYGNGKTVIERYQVENQNVDEASGYVILEIDQYAKIHNGGTMNFGNDGYLYIAMGDGGGQRDPENFSQNLSELLGKMLRIDVNPDILFKSNFQNVTVCSEVVNYWVPEDNPFISQNDKCDEIFLYGLRSPWKWSFDKQTQDIFIGDVGQDGAEEISFISATSNGGENLGWSCMEGHLIILPERCPQNMSSLTNPIISYDHTPLNTGNSIVGGYRYRGDAIPELVGTYIYTDTLSGEVWFAELIDNQWVSTLWDQTLNFVVSFGEDEFGNLYTVSIGGSMKKFIINE